MPRKPNKTLRLLVPLALILGGIGVAAAVFVNTGTRPQAPAPVTVQEEEAVGQAEDAARPGDGPARADDTPTGDENSPARAESAPDPADDPAPRTTPDETPDPAPSMTSTEEAGSLGALRALAVPVETPAPIGSLDENSGMKLRVEFANLGAAIKEIALTDHFDSIKREVHTIVQKEMVRTVDSTAYTISPFMAMEIRLADEWVPVTGSPDAPVWRQTSHSPSSSTFTATIVDDTDTPVLRLTRTYTLVPGKYEIFLDQHVENLSGRPLDVTWRQFGPVDMRQESSGYGGEQRRVRFGYLVDAQLDPSRQFVSADDFYWRRASGKVTGSRDKTVAKVPDAAGKLRSPYKPLYTIWPNERSVEREYDLVWSALTNRYFGVAVFPTLDPENPAPDKRLENVRTIDRLFLNAVDGSGMALRYTSPSRVVEPGASAEFGFSIYAGPQARTIIRDDPGAEMVGLTRLVKYNFGGPCAFCTFPVLANLLLWLLYSLGGLVHDYGVAIVILVIIVRTCLHPVTRWSQIRMQRFAKQMQNIAPKQKKIQEKYKDDRQKIQQETAKLWREEGISPAGFLGCLPMFLQSPVWIALYATLFFAFELRHQPAFYGVFQLFGGWTFLGDLAEPDRAFYFGRTLINIPLMGAISSINLLPLLLGVVFWIHQKYLTPPTSAAMTPEQESQQKMIRVMSVVMFPVIMYNAPSGLALYFITNSTLAILETRWIRAHMNKHGMLDDDKLKKNRKPPKQGGFLQRLQQVAEQQQQMRAQQGKPGAKPTARRGPTPPTKRADPNRRNKRKR